MDRQARQYVRKLEEALADRSDGPRVFSRQDYDLAIRWYRQGIPAGLILETLAARKTGARSLSQVAGRVEDSWAAVRSGASAGAREAESDSAGDGEALLAAALQTAPAGTGLQRLLEELLTAVRAGMPADELERILESGLPRAVGARRFAEAEERARAALRQYRDRMPPGVFRETVRKGALARLRRELGIPRFR